MILGIAVMSVALVYFGVAVALIALKRVLPQRSGAVTETRLAIVGDRRLSFGVFYVKVRFEEGDELRVPFSFWSADKLRIKASFKYTRLQEAFPVGAGVKLAYLPKGEWLFGYIPFSPVLRVETMVYVVMTILSGMMLWSLLSD